MESEITRAKARKLLNVPTNYQLAKALGCFTQQVYQWQEHAPLPKPRQKQIKAMLAERRE